MAQWTYPSWISATCGGRSWLRKQQGNKTQFAILNRAGKGYDEPFAQLCRT
jgi:hypothetical protein